MKHLKFLSSFYPDWSWDMCHRVAKVLRLDLDDKIHQMSKGQKMKLSIAGELAKQPKLLLLDEPMDGLDPIVRDDFAELLFEYMENEEHSLIYSTHIIPEIERMVDKVTLLDNGKIVANEYKEDMIENWRKIDVNITNRLDDKPFIQKQEDKADSFTITTNNFEECMRHLANLNIGIRDSHYMTIQEIVLIRLR
jgi:ABC-2 type transport system ATP-binding protein